MHLKFHNILIVPPFSTNGISIPLKHSLSGMIIVCNTWFLLLNLLPLNPQSKAKVREWQPPPHQLPPTWMLKEKNKNKRNFVENSWNIAFFSLWVENCHGCYLQSFLLISNCCHIFWGFFELQHFHVSKCCQHFKIFQTATLPPFNFWSFSSFPCFPSCY